MPRKLLPSEVLFVLIDKYTFRVIKFISFQHLKQQFETIFFPQDMIHEIYKLHWNIIHKSTGVT